MQQEEEQLRRSHCQWVGGGASLHSYDYNETRSKLISWQIESHGKVNNERDPKQPEKQKIPALSDNSNSLIQTCHHDSRVSRKDKDNTENKNENNNNTSALIRRARDGIMAAHSTATSFLQMKKIGKEKSSAKLLRRKDDEYKPKNSTSLKRGRCNEHNNLENSRNMDVKKSRIMSKPLPQDQENHYSTSNYSATPFIKKPNASSKKRTRVNSLTEKTVQFSDTKRGQDLTHFFYFDKNRTSLSSSDEFQNQNNTDSPLSKYLQKTDPQSSPLNSSAIASIATSPKRLKENTIQSLSVKLRKRSRFLFENSQIQSSVTTDEHDTDFSHVAKRRNYGLPDHNGRNSSSRLSLRKKGNEIAYKKILIRHKIAEERIWKQLNEFHQKEENQSKLKGVASTNGDTVHILKDVTTGTSKENCTVKTDPKLLLDNGSSVKTDSGEQKDTTFTFGTTPKIEKNTSKNSTKADYDPDITKASTNNAVFSFGNESDSKNGNSKSVPNLKPSLAPTSNGTEQTDESTTVGFTFNTNKSDTIIQSSILTNGTSTTEPASNSSEPAFSFGKNLGSNNLSESATSNRLSNSFNINENNGTTSSKEQNGINSNGTSVSTFTFGKNNEKIETAQSSHPTNGILVGANFSQPNGGFSLGSKGPRVRRKIGTSRRRR